MSRWLLHNRIPTRRSWAALLLGVFLIAAGGPASAQEELSYQEYQDLAWAAHRIDHLAVFEPLEGQAGMLMALADRFGTVHVIRMTGRGAESVWKSNSLGGIPQELLVTDLSGDGLEDALICRTSIGRVYVWSLDGYTQLWESLSGEYQQVTCFTTANLDEDPAREIVMIADGRLVQVDGETFTKDFTSLDEYRATMIRCGDVDGDGRAEVVLNTGKVVDPITGNLEWEDEPFFARIELLDIDADGMPEILTENEAGGPLKVYDVDRRAEVRFQ